MVATVKNSSSRMVKKTMEPRRIGRSRILPQVNKLTNLQLKKIISDSGLQYGSGISKAKKADLLKHIDYIKKQKGAGFLDNLISRVKNLGSKVTNMVSNVSDKIKSWLFFPPDKLPIKAAKVFEKYAKSEIQDIEIRREPLQSMVKSFLNFISFGQLDKKLKELNYDDVMHLSMAVIFRNGSRVSIEKNERINIVEGYTGNPGKQQMKNVDRSLLENNRITLETLLGKAQQNMGDFKFFQYNAKSNNCQDFLLGILDANNLNNANLREFIKQDATEIFKALPDFMDKFAQGVTDLAGKVSELTGQGKRKRIRRRGKITKIKSKSKSKNKK
jgi:hypothetical protein